MKRNYFLSSITRPVDASNLVRSLLRHPSTVVQGLKGGLEYIWSRKSLLGMDEGIDSLAALIVHEANTMVSFWIGRHKRTSGCFQMALRIRFVIDSYGLFRVKFGSGYEESRLVCYFNLAELYRGNGETKKCLDLLELCESVAKSFEGRRSISTGKLPSVQVVRTCLAEVLLCHRETKLSLDKSREVILFFQTRMGSCLSDSEWTTFTYALFVHCEACVKLEDLIGVEGCLSMSKQIRMQCSNFEVVIPILDRLDKTGRSFRATFRQSRRKEDLVKNWRQIAEEFDNCIQKRPRSASHARLQSSATVGRPHTASLICRSKPLTVQSGDVFDVEPVQARALTVQSGDGFDIEATPSRPLTLQSGKGFDIEPIPSRPLTLQSGKGFDIEPLPSRPLIVSTSALVEVANVPMLELTKTLTTVLLNDSNDPWISFISKTSGKVFFYNQTSGQSVWQKPPT